MKLSRNIIYGVGVAVAILALVAYLELSPVLTLTDDNGNVYHLHTPGALTFPKANNHVINIVSMKLKRGYALTVLTYPANYTQTVRGPIDAGLDPASHALTWTDRDGTKQTLSYQINVSTVTVTKT